MTDAPAPLPELSSSAPSIRRFWPVPANRMVAASAALSGLRLIRASWMRRESFGPASWTPQTPTTLTSTSRMTPYVLGAITPQLEPAGVTVTWVALMSMLASDTSAPRSSVPLTS